MNWRVHAACAGQHDVFFSPDDYEHWTVHRDREARARAICAGCPVRAECAAFALTSAAEFGIWGGMSESELRDLRPKTPGRSRTIQIARPRGPYRKKAA